MSRKVSETPFTDWVKAGAKEEDWEKYLAQAEWKTRKRKVKGEILKDLFIAEKMYYL